MTFWEPLNKTQQLFRWWPFWQGMKLLWTKTVLSKNRENYHLLETAHYSEIERAGYAVQKKDSDVFVRRADWPLAGVFIRRYSTDYHVFRQIFLNDEYDPLIQFIGSNEPIRTIIDAGANTGMASLRLKMAFPLSKLYCLEPDTGNFECLQKNIGINRVNAVLLQNAVWSRDADLYFNRQFRDGREWSVSVVEEENDEAPVTAVCLDSLVKQHSISQIDLLKLDVEGSEADIFFGNGAETSFLEITRFIAVEVHEEKVAKEQVVAFLHKKGFALSVSGEYLIGRNNRFVKNTNLT